MMELSVLELMAPLARTSTADGTGVDLTGYVEAGGRKMKAYLSVGAKSGTPTLDVHLEESDSLATGYADIVGAVFAQKTDVGNETIHFQAKKKYVRASWVVGGGTPNITCACIVVATKRIK